MLRSFHQSDHNDSHALRTQLEDRVIRQVGNVNTRAADFVLKSLEQRLQICV